MENNHFPIARELSIPVEANTRYESLSLTELRHADGCRIIGGDRGDLRFEGFSVEEGKTILYKPVLVNFANDAADWSEDEQSELAEEILQFAYEGLGAECVEH